MEKANKLQKTFKNASTVLGLTLISRILGLWRDILLARYLGPEVRDAFIVAYRFPTSFRRLFHEGSLHASLAPAVAANKDSDHQFRLLMQLFLVLCVVAILVTVLALVGMPQIIESVLAGRGFQSVPGKLDLTTSLSRWTFASLAASLAIGLLGFVYHLRGKFAFVGSITLGANVALIVVMRLNREASGVEVLLAQTVFWIALIQALAMLLALGKELLQLQEFLPWNQVLHFSIPFWKSFFPAFLSHGIAQVSVWVAVGFASFLGSGAHSALYLADRILELPVSLLASSLVLGISPILASMRTQHGSANNSEKISQRISEFLSLIWFLAWPAALGMFLLAAPIAEVLFMKGELRFSEATAITEVLRVYAPGIVFLCFSRLLSSILISMGALWYPLIAAGVGLFVQVIFSIAFLKGFQVMGLGLAATLGWGVQMVLLWLPTLRWYKLLNFRDWVWSLRASVVAGLGLVLVCVFIESYINWVGHILRKSVILGLTIFFAGVVYFAISWLLKAREIEFVKAEWSRFSTRQ